MRGVRRTMLMLMLLGLGVPTAIFAASTVTRVPAAVTPAGCSAHLASPDQQGPYTADYFSPQADWTPRDPNPVVIHIAAYAPNHDTEAPTITDEKVLFGDRLVSPLDGGSWSIDPTPTQVVRGQLSTLYCYTARWTVPSAIGAYYLALTFHFQNFTVLGYYVNETVDAAPQTLTGLWHWQTTLTGMGAQNLDNNGYNLLDPHISGNTITAQTVFYFDGNPAATRLSPGSPRSTSYIDGGMVNQREQGTNNIFHILPKTVYVPYLAPGQAHSDNSRDPVQYSAEQGGPSQDVAVSVDACVGAIVPCAVGGHSYKYRVVVTEPVVLRAGSPATSFVYAGSYVVDNAFNGYAEGYGYGANVGEGQGFLFYANPGIPGGDRDPRAPTLVNVHWAPVDPSTYDTHTTLTYNLDVCPPPSPAPVDPCQHYTALSNPSDNGLAEPGDVYTATVQAIFMNGAYEIDSERMSGPLPPPASGAALTPTPTPPPFTDTATPVPPTATPVPPTATPTPARAVAVLAQDAHPYAWVRAAHAEDATASDGLYATTWNVTPTDLYWPVGRPLHLLPALDTHTLDARLILTDQGNGAVATLLPTSVQATGYTVDELGAAGGQGCGPAFGGMRAYDQDSHYPGEVSPFSPRMAVVWSPAGVAGSPATGTTRCDLAAALHAGVPLQVRYSVTERLVFTARFPDPPSAALAGTSADCTGNLAPDALAAPVSRELGVPAPAPAFATPGPVVRGACPGGGVGLAAARAAVTSAASAFTVSNPDMRIASVTATAPAPTVLTIVINVTRDLALRVHLLVPREVAP